MVYSPSFLSYGWKGSRAYTSTDIPTPSGVTGNDRTILEQRFAYEWYDQSGRYAAGRNPPFATRSAGQLAPSLVENGVPPRVLRGFIRRAEYDATDYKSGSRLYFMYNPTEITRDYVSYLDQGALDPFNSVFQSGNLVPPPSFMDFTFSLLFDRQTEAMDSNHPGVFVDYEYFDLVVRNVVPVIDPNNNAAATLPDNGVMMVNPRDITVVFSPQITVQGRPSNAKVQFLRFTHRMVPTRMQIDLTMRVTYFGPMKDMTTYPGEEAIVTESVPWEAVQSPFTMTTADIQAGYSLFMEDMKATMFTPERINQIIEMAEENGGLVPGTGDRWDLSELANGPINESIVDFALSKCNDADGPPEYVGADGDNGHYRNQLWKYCDCSSFWWAAHADHNPPYSAQMGADMAISMDDAVKGRVHIPSTTTIIDLFRDGTIPSAPIFSTTSNSLTERRKVIEPNLAKMMKGDTLARRKGQTDDSAGHIGFVYANDPAGRKIDFVDAAKKGMVGKRSLSYATILDHYTDCFRSLLGTPNSPDAQNPPAPGD